jgi:hypothetical protein
MIISFELKINFFNFYLFIYFLLFIFKLRLYITLNGQLINEILTENDKEGNGHDIVLW